MVTSRAVRASNTAPGRWISFTGRTRRAPFWTWTGTVFGLIGASLALQLIPSAGDGMMWARVAGVLSLLIILIAFVPNLAMLVRRLHDANLPTWVVLIGVIPGLGGLILLTIAMLPSNPRGRRFDRAGTSVPLKSKPDKKKPASAGTHARSAPRAVTAGSAASAAPERAASSRAASSTRSSGPARSGTSGAGAESARAVDAGSGAVAKPGAPAKPGTPGQPAPRLTRSSSSRSTRR